MPGERFVYALADWTVEKRANGWYFARSANRHSRGDWKGPYRSEAGVAMMIARELRWRSSSATNGRCPRGWHEHGKDPGTQRRLSHHDDWGPRRHDCRRRRAGLRREGDGY